MLSNLILLFSITFFGFEYHTKFVVHD